MKRRRQILIVAGIILSLVVLLPVIRHFQLRFAVENDISDLKLQGEPIELAQVIPSPTPPEQNGVPLIINALTNLVDEGSVNNIFWTNPPEAMQMIAPGKAMIGWQEPMIIGDRGIAEPRATNSWNDLSRELAGVKSDLDAFQNLTNHPVLDFNLDYADPQNLKLPHTSWLQISARWFDASALCHLHKGAGRHACADVRAMLAIVKGESQERPAISQFVRIAIAIMAAKDTWEILQSRDVSNGDLAQLQQEWQSLTFIEPLGKAFQYELVADLRIFKQTRESSARFNQLWKPFFAPDAPVKLDLDQLGPIRRSLFLRKCDELRWRWFWSYEDELYELKLYQELMRTMRMLETSESSLLQAQSLMSSNLATIPKPAYWRGKSWNCIRVGGMQFYASSAVRKVASVEVARSMVVTALALKRYELRHHQYPRTLDQMVPDLLTSVPTDCMDGHKLRYRLNSDGTFVLYSVGKNGKDDDGNPAMEKDAHWWNYYWLNPHALDWVWPQPATKQEIREYFKKKAKYSN